MPPGSKSSLALSPKHPTFAPFDAPARVRRSRTEELEAALVLLCLGSVRQTSSIGADLLAYADDDEADHDDKPAPEKPIQPAVGGAHQRGHPAKADGHAEGQFVIGPLVKTFHGARTVYRAAVAFAIGRQPARARPARLHRRLRIVRKPALVHEL